MKKDLGIEGQIAPQKARGPPKVSIIIPNYNGKRFLKDCISSIQGVRYPRKKYEIILVDNGSSDSSIDYVRANFPSVKILALHKNYGFAGGNNHGAKIATGELLVFLSNDTVVDRNWLYNLVKVMAHEEIGICGSKILFMKAKDIAQYNGGSLHLLGGPLATPYIKYEPNNGYCIVGCIAGASFAIRKNIFEEVGGFDDDFFAYSDEADLCMRTWVHGYFVAYSTRSIIYHYAGGTAYSQWQGNLQTVNILFPRLLSSITMYYSNRNSIIYIIKNFEVKNLFLGILFSYFYLLFQMILVACNKSGTVMPLIKAGLWPIKNLSIIWKKRMCAQRERKISDKWLKERHLLLSLSETIRTIVQLRESLKP